MQSQFWPMLCYWVVICNIYKMPIWGKKLLEINDLINSKYQYIFKINLENIYYAIFGRNIEWADFKCLNECYFTIQMLSKLHSVHRLLIFRLLLASSLQFDWGYMMFDIFIAHVAEDDVSYRLIERAYRDGRQ